MADAATLCPDRHSTSSCFDATTPANCAATTVSNELGSVIAVKYVNVYLLFLSSVAFDLNVSDMFVPNSETIHDAFPNCQVRRALTGGDFLYRKSHYHAFLFSGRPSQKLYGFLDHTQSDHSYKASLIRQRTNCRQISLI